MFRTPGWAIPHKCTCIYAKHTRTHKQTWQKQTTPPSDAHLSHTRKQINTLLLFPVPSGTLDAYSMEEEAHLLCLFDNTSQQTFANSHTHTHAHRPCVPFLSVTVDNSSFSDHLNKYFMDYVTICLATFPTWNSLQAVSCGTWELSIFSIVFFLYLPGGGGRS